MSYTYSRRHGWRITEPFPSIKARFVSMRKLFKKVEWQVCQLRESSICKEKNYHNRQILVKVRFKFQPFLSDPFAPAISQAANRGLEVSGSHGSSGPLGGGGPCWDGSGIQVTSSIKSAFTTVDPWKAAIIAWPLPAVAL